MSDQSLSYVHLLHKSWPIILANAAVPLLGFVDTAVIGHYDSSAALAALAASSLMFSFVYWAFGFLRMSTTAKVAYYAGADNNKALLRTCLQSVFLAVVFALCLLLLQSSVLFSALSLFSPPIDIVAKIESYFSIRIWAAPATLLLYVISGVFIGLGANRYVLYVQLVLNGANAVFDVYFVAVLEQGIKGVALGTCLAEYTTLILASALLLRLLKPRLCYINVFAGDFFIGFFDLIKHNSDIFVRTLFLLLGFVFFTRIGGQLGVLTLAANHILMQFIVFSAFFLDGYAYVLEELSGKAFGKKSGVYLKLAFKRITYIAAATAMFLACVVLFLGGFIIEQLTPASDVQDIAQNFLPYTSLYILFAFAAFQLDGLFIGAAFGKALRNASVLSTLLFVLLWYGGFHILGNLGLWLAFIAFICLRALSLTFYLPELFRRI